MSDEKKCSKENLCQDCQGRLEEVLAKHEDWEVNCKKYIEENQMYTHHYGSSLIQYSITGGYSFLPCPQNCGKSAIKKNDFGDQIELEHECKVEANSQVKSSQVKSSQVKSSQVKSSQESASDLGNKSNYLPWVLGGIGLIVLIGTSVYFLTRKKK